MHIVSLKNQDKTLEYHFEIHHEGQGFWAKCVEFEGCFTQGDTLEELERNMQEALDLYLEEDPDDFDEL